MTHYSNITLITQNSCKTRMYETYKLSDLLNHVVFVLYMPSDAFLLYILSFFTCLYNLLPSCVLHVLYVHKCFVTTFRWTLHSYSAPSSIHVCYLSLLLPFLIYFILTMKKYIRILLQLTCRLRKLKTVYIFLKNPYLHYIT